MRQGMRVSDIPGDSGERLARFPEDEEMRDETKNSFKGQWVKGDSQGWGVPSSLMQSRDTLRSSEPGSSQNLNGNLNSLVVQEFKNVPFYEEDLTKPFLTEHLAEKLKLPLEVQLHSHSVLWRAPGIRQLRFRCVRVPSSHCACWDLAVSQML